MQARPPAAAQRTPVMRLAIAGAAMDAVIPLLPLYNGFIFSTGLPPRQLAAYFVARWANALVVTGGVMLLARGRPAVSAGVFGAVGIGLAITIVSQLLSTFPALWQWQTLLVLALESAAAVLLLGAAARAVGIPREEPGPAAPAPAPEVPT